MKKVKSLARYGILPLVGLGLCLALIMSMASPSGAQHNTSTVGQGQLPPNETPCLPQSVAQSSGTTEVILRSAPGWVSWVLMSTATVDGTHYTVFQDTSTESNEAVDLFRLHPASTVQATKFTFQPPAYFANGIAVTKSHVLDWVTICTRQSNTQTDTRSP